MNGILTIVGAGGHARVVADMAGTLGWTVSLFGDNLVGQFSGPWQVIKAIAWLKHNPGGFDGIGNNATRLRLQQDIAARGGMPCTPAPRAWVQPQRQAWGRHGDVRRDHNQRQRPTGAACIINIAATVDHNCDLAEGVHISPGAHLAGGVTVGARSWVGIGAAVRQQIRIGQNAIIGAGTAVVSDVADATTVVGTPASPLIRS